MLHPTDGSWASPYFNAPVLARTNHASPTIIAYAVVILQTGSFFGRMICGPLADRFGVWKVFITAGLSSTITLLAFWVTGGINDAAVVSGLFGLGMFSGAFMSLIGAACAAISPVEEVGTRIGILWTVSGFPCLAGPVICGGEWRDASGGVMGVMVLTRSSSWGPGRSIRLCCYLLRDHDLAGQCDYLVPSPHASGGGNGRAKAGKAGQRGN